MDSPIYQAVNDSDDVNTSISAVDSISYTGHLLVGTMLVIFGKINDLIIIFLWKKSWLD